MNSVHLFNHHLHGLLLDYSYISPNLTSINDFAIVILVGSPYNWNAQLPCRYTYKVICLLGKFHKTYSVLVKKNYKLTHPVAPLKLQHTLCDWLYVRAILAPRNSYVNNISLKSQKLLPGVQYTNKTKPSGSTQTGLGWTLPFTFTQYTQQCYIR